MESAARLAAAAAVNLPARLAARGFELDAAQRAAVAGMVRPGIRSGIYLHGPVGRGKTVLADEYFAAIPTRAKRRVHVHAFFRELHGRLFRSRRPLDRVLAGMLGGARAIMFDEFHVHDVADAVYLTRLLELLVARDVLVIATSNYTPAELLPDPLFHDRFVPAIRLIEAHFDVIDLGDGPDYRLRGGDGTGFGAGGWTIAGPQERATASVRLVVNGLPVDAVSAADGRAAFTFDALCRRPLGTREYLELARRFDAIELLDVPDLADAEREAAQRFADLVDVLHDRGVPTRIVSAAGPGRLLDAVHVPRDAVRTVSRLALLPQDIDKVDTDA